VIFIASCGRADFATVLAGHSLDHFDALVEVTLVAAHYVDGGEETVTALDVTRDVFDFEVALGVCI
jgi:hypothetical protein